MIEIAIIVLKRVLAVFSLNEMEKKRLKDYKIRNNLFITKPNAFIPFNFKDT